MQETQETQVPSLGQEKPLEKETATHSSILAWVILWTEETGRLQSRESRRVRHNWAPAQKAQAPHRVKMHLGDPGSSHHLRATLWQILIQNYTGRLLPNSKFWQIINDCGCFKPLGFGVITSAARKLIHRGQLWRASPVSAVFNFSFHPILPVISHEYWSQHLLKRLCRKINSEFVFQGTQSWNFVGFF